MSNYGERFYLQKMEKYNVAKVKSQGVKGTYIEMIGELE
jgi:hypothetical protein